LKKDISSVAGIAGNAITYEPVEIKILLFVIEMPFLWNNGMLEYWARSEVLALYWVKIQKNHILIDRIPLNPLFHHSITPLFSRLVGMIEANYTAKGHNLGFFLPAVA